MVTSSCSSSDRFEVPELIQHGKTSLLVDDRGSVGHWIVAVWSAACLQACEGVCVTLGVTGILLD